MTDARIDEKCWPRRAFACGVAAVLVAVAGIGCQRPACPTVAASPTVPLMESPKSEAPVQASVAPVSPAFVTKLEAELVAKHGAAHAALIRRGLGQVAARWRAADGTEEELADLARAQLVVDPAARELLFKRLEYTMEMLDGHGNSIDRELNRFQDLDEDAEQPIDALLSAYSPDAHVVDDLFRGKIAFVALLNFPLSTLAERVANAQTWTRQQWATARLVGRFEFRVPPEVLQQMAQASSQAEGYINGYNLRMGHLLSESGEKPFPADLRLVSHWGLRDEIRGQYSKPGGLERQRLIARAMERIVRQEIPAAVIDSASVDWDPVKNLVRKGTGPLEASPREPDTRYAKLQRVFQVTKAADPYFPGYASFVERAFERDRELSEARVRQLLTSVLESPTAVEVAAEIKRRLGRPLEPFDIWYAGFRRAGSADEGALDSATKKRYPTPAAFRADLPRILRDLGFTADTAKYLQDHIAVDPSRGPGHALGARRRDDQAHLRTRVGKDGMDYKGYNIAVHELGHNVEQVFSMSKIDHTLLDGVPSSGFTEAFAFLFQARDRELLGQAKADAETDMMRTLDRFWSTFEISGVGLVDTEMWQWLYAHPGATPAEFREASVKIAEGVWNKYFAPVLGVRDVGLLGIYSHIIAFSLYTPDYSLGYLITSQIERFMRGKNLGTEMERMCRQGRLTPDAWMRGAVGNELSSAPLIEATREALKALKRP